MSLSAIALVYAVDRFIAYNMNEYCNCDGKLKCRD